MTRDQSFFEIADVQLLLGIEHFWNVRQRQTQITGERNGGSRRKWGEMKQVHSNKDTSKGRDNNFYEFFEFL